MTATTLCGEPVNTVFRRGDLWEDGRRERCWRTLPRLTTTKWCFDMANAELPSSDVLRQLLRYDPDTGVFTWNERSPAFFPNSKNPEDHCASWNTRFSGKQAFVTHDGKGYLVGGIFNRQHQAHRVAWAIYHGYWPSGEIDHINRNRSDNRISNLRDVSSAENSHNLPIFVNNRSGILGVDWYERKGKWRAQIMANGKLIHLGYFADKRKAAQARRNAERQYGFHDTHGTS